MNIVEVVVPGVLDHGFDYAVPEGMSVLVGTMVRVPFSGRELLGVVWGMGRGDVAPAKVKSILAALPFPPFSDCFREFLRFAAWYNAAPISAVVKMALPIADAEKEGRAKAHVAPFDAAAMRLAALSAEQTSIAGALSEKLGGGFGVSVLDGVTGSGKTEVYFEVIARALEGGVGNQILVLLPEIALSIQWLARFEERFGFAPVLWHSNVTPARRRAGSQAVANGTARVVVGARSALFLPFANLSLIVVDEEHDGSYKQEEGVMYHARDMAVARARHEKIPALLVSATPSLETVANMRAGKYAEFSLPLRHGAANLPRVELVDMREQPLERDQFISPVLRKALSEALACGHQSMLFLNRRGYAPLTLCRACGHRFQCPDCSAWLVLHQHKNSGGMLRCHHCDYRIPLPPACPACQKEETLHPCGPGVERLVEEVSHFLPQARVATLASDSTESARELQSVIERMERGEVDVLIGTQMLAKGHHFAGLSVVGVVDADLGLNGGDLRAAEKTYQLLHQVSGRAGREQVAGHVYVQSYAPDHPVMQALAASARDAFVAAELAAREAAHMPPYTRLAALIVEGHKEDEVLATCKHLLRITNQESRVTIYGPAPAPLFLLRGKFRYRFLVKAPRTVNLPDYLRSWVDSAKAPRSVRVKIDIDPQSFM